MLASGPLRSRCGDYFFAFQFPTFRRLDADVPKPTIAARPRPTKRNLTSSSSLLKKCSGCQVPGIRFGVVPGNAGEWVKRLSGAALEWRTGS